MDDIKGMIDNLRNMMRMEPIGARAAGEKLKMQLSPIPESISQRIDRAVTEIENQEKKIITLFPAPIVSAGKQGRWYIGPTESSSPNWNAYREHLEQKGWGADAIH